MSESQTANIPVQDAMLETPETEVQGKGRGKTGSANLPTGAMTQTTPQTAVIERPILMSGDLVRATLRGRKTQTRRIMTPHNTRLFSPSVGMFKPAPELLAQALTEVKGVRHIEESTFVWQAKAFDYQYGDRTHWQGTCEYGAPGDRLWIRETFYPCNFIRAGERVTTIYAADCPNGKNSETIKFKPSIHMPRDRCRLILDIEDIRMERLQDISENDCYAEGVDEDSDDPVLHYAAIWDGINGVKGPKGWNENPWVWAITYRPVEA